MKRLKELYNLEDLRALCENRSIPEGAILSEAVAFATKHTNSDLGFISVVDFTDERLLHSKKRFLFTTMPGGYRYNQRFSLQIGGEELPQKERSLSGLVASTRKPYRCGNVKKDAFYLSMNEDVLSEVVVPIEHKGTLLGVMNLESYRQDHYRQAHENFLRCVAK